MADGGEVREADVAVVGAGFAGLAAALRLADEGADVVVVEARDRVGGRVLNEPIGDGKVLEVGGQWIGPGQDRLRAWAQEVGVETYPTHSAGDNLVEFDGRLRRYRGTIPRINALVLADVAQAQARLEWMARRVPLEDPARAPRAADWDSQTFWTWIRRNARTRGARALLQLGTEAVWAAHPADVSLLHVLFYIHSGGGFERLISTEGGAQAERFVGGSQLVALRMAERLGEGRIVLGAPVRRVAHGGDGVRITGDGGLEVRARRAIVTLPPALAGRLVYEPALPGLRDQLTQRMPMGSVVKCMAIYDEPFWRADGLSGQVTSDAGPVKVAFDNTPHDGTPGVLLGFLEGRQARELGAVSQDERRRAVVDCFARFFGPRAAEPRAYIDRSWADEEFSRGCYGGFMTPNGWTDFGRALRAPIGPLHWAGAETATVWNGYIDGAIRSGERAAGEALAALERPAASAAAS